jgi:uncharacterized protein
MPDRPRVLLLPGLGDSGPEHWQSHWERAAPDTFARLRHHEWDAPRRADWVRTLDAAVTRCGSGVVLAAHSTACALVAFWAAETGRTIRGALLVAPSDTEAPSYPEGPTGWAPMPLHPLPFATIVVASDLDPYVTSARARHFADAWGSRYVEVQGGGHLGSASGLGAWPQGRALLADLLETGP